MPAKKAAKAPAVKKAPARKEARVEGISKKDIGPLRKQLTVMRDDLQRKIAQKREEEVVGGAEIGDEADIASQSLEKEINFELSDNERQMLDQAEAALRKIDKGSFGICESCQQPIGKERIKALPFARYCINCQARNESFAGR